MTTLGPSRRIGRPVRTPGGGRPTPTENDARVRVRVGTPTYTAADRRVANAVRGKLARGTFNRDPRLKARVINLLAIMDTAGTGRVARVPDRNDVKLVMDTLRGINSRVLQPIGRRPTERVPPFEVTPSPATGDGTLREVSFRWDYGDDVITGFNLYMDGEKVCEFTPETVRNGVCDVEATEDVHTFTLTAINAAGLESDDSNPVVRSFTPDE